MTRSRKRRRFPRDPRQKKGKGGSPVSVFQTEGNVTYPEVHLPVEASRDKVAVVGHPRQTGHALVVLAVAVGDHPTCRRVPELDRGVAAGEEHCVVWAPRHVGDGLGVLSEDVHLAAQLNKCNRQNTFIYNTTTSTLQIITVVSLDADAM